MPIENRIIGIFLVLGITGIVYATDLVISSDTLVNLDNGAYITLLAPQNFTNTSSPVMVIYNSTDSPASTLELNFNNTLARWNTLTNKSLYNISYNNSTDVYLFRVSGTSGYLNLSIRMNNPNIYYDLKVDNVVSQTKSSDISSVVWFNYSGSWGDHLFEILEDFDINGVNTYTKTCTGLTNGSWCNLSSPINVISGTTNFTFVSPNATGGTITDVGGYRIHTFTSNGTFTPNSNFNVEYLVIGGGGGGGNNNGGGGGGAGGWQNSSSYSVTTSTYPIVVGSGGAGALAATPVSGGNGSNSSFGTIIAIGGGGGGGQLPSNGSNGGSGGGGAASGGITNGGIGTQGYNGGANGQTSLPYPSGAGGGAGGIGGSGGSGVSGSGGIGNSSSISGLSIYYAGGGGGGGTVQGATNGTGGNGGGGYGGVGTGQNGINGTPNTGGGGGGAGGGTSYSGGWGGSGIVVIRYLYSTANNVYAIPQNHPKSENKTSDTSPIQVNFTINSSNQIQNIQFFKNTSGSFDVTLNLVTNVSADTTPPNTPVLNSTGNTTTSVSLSSTTEADYNKYFWEYKLNTSGTWLLWGNTSINTTTVTGLIGGGIYDFRLNVTDFSDNYSPYSNVITIQTQTTDPTDALIIAQLAAIQAKQIEQDSSIESVSAMGILGGIIGGVLAFALIRRKQKD